MDSGSPMSFPGLPALDMDSRLRGNDRGSAGMTKGVRE